MEVETMMQGDAYGLNIEIVNASGVAVTPEDVSDVEITVGFLRKTYAKGEITHSSNGKWVFPMTQEETFKLPASHVKAQVRVLWPNGYCEGASLGSINVHESISKEVL
jgi:hypothetical protein